MNLCTDQVAMLLAAPGQLISVSDLAQDPRMFKNGEISDAKDRSIDDEERGQENRTIEVEFMLIQPHQANRTRFRSDEIRESYRTIFTFNRSQ